MLHIAFILLSGGFKENLQVEKVCVVIPTSLVIKYILKKVNDLRRKLVLKREATLMHSASS